MEELFRAYAITFGWAIVGSIAMGNRKLHRMLFASRMGQFHNNFITFPPRPRNGDITSFSPKPILTYES